MGFSPILESMYKEYQFFRSNSGFWHIEKLQWKSELVYYDKNRSRKKSLTAYFINYT